MSEVTQILNAINQGEPEASHDLLPIVYDELRKLARLRLAREASGHTLQPTALVHEAWLRLAGTDNQSWESRGHFFAAAAEAMRRILIDSARRKKAEKHGGKQERVELRDIEEPSEASEDMLLRVHEALDELAREDSQSAKLVQLRFFTGLSVEEAALALGITDRTARRYWRFARAWLYARLSRE